MAGKAVMSEAKKLKGETLRVTRLDLTGSLVPLRTGSEPGKARGK